MNDALAIYLMLLALAIFGFAVLSINGDEGD
jgi:hypothetical protein